MTTEALREAFDTELKKVQAKKAESGGVALSLSAKAFHALLRQQFQTDRAGNILVGNTGGVLPREVEWGQGTSVQIAQFAAGIVELQQTILAAYLDLQKGAIPHDPGTDGRNVPSPPVPERQEHRPNPTGDVDQRAGSVAENPGT